MKVIFSDFAAKEFSDSQSFYEIEVPGLGNIFKEEVKKAINRIQQFPESFPLITTEIRKCIVRKFPYNILYSIEQDFILILAISHQHRRPFYWAE